MGGRLCSRQMIPLLMKALLMTPTLLLVSEPFEPSEFSDSASDSDHSSDVVIVEPVDQAAAVVPSVGDLLTASDFTPHLLNDMHAPMVTVILEEQALAPARVLARAPYLEHLLGLVQQGCETHQLPAACAPALERAHADLATYLAVLLAGLFDSARLAALPDALVSPAGGPHGGCPCTPCPDQLHC